MITKSKPRSALGWIILGAVMRGIFFNRGLASAGRISFTLAHELGHYLIHRVAYPNGFRCGDQDVVRWDSEYGQVEHQANVFAANLLMPLDDYRRFTAGATLGSR
jgi:Zn-dependent peptidase ImmA (M78 family)